MYNSQVRILVAPFVRLCIQRSASVRSYALHCVCTISDTSVQLLARSLPLELLEAVAEIIRTRHTKPLILGGIIVVTQPFFYFTEVGTQLSLVLVMYYLSIYVCIYVCMYVYMYVLLLVYSTVNGDVYVVQ